MIHFWAMTNALLIRHAQSTWNAESRAQGWSDPPLSEAGVAQVYRLAPGLAGLGIGGVASSDLVRARTTAGILAGSLGLAPPSIDARLRERELGWWTGHTGEETEAGWPEEVAAWRAHQLDRPPGGESTDSVTRRVTAALVDLVPGLAGGAVLLLVTHGGVISALERRLPHPPDRSGAHPNLSGRWAAVAGGEIILGSRFDPASVASAAGNRLETD
ncbi:MAG TPA: histidine phosphatase family protein [Acidimicrobiales bacterium]|nr:histidine phosphatase family protein [Acidimicrobiales bacterium]